MDEVIIREEKYHENLPVWPAVEVFDKTIDGLVPATRIKSWKDFESVVASLRDGFDGDEFVFRGHAHYRWFLEPTLDRFADRSISSVLAETQLQNFRRSIRGRILDRSLLEADAFANDPQSLELWAIGQHHGLATPLLDWSRSPYVSLFFAFENPDDESWVDEKGNPTNHSRAIYVLNREFIADADPSDDEKYLQIVEPAKDDHGRLVNQAGLFTFAPYGETLESSLLKALADSKVDIDDPSEVAKYICKIHIPNSPENRRECLRQLRHMNIHHASLFPDLIGSSLYCNELAREYVVKKSSQTSSPKGDRAEREDFWQGHTLPVDDKGLKPLADALLVSDAAREVSRPDDLLMIARMVVDFINSDSGVDWFARESELARLRTIVRRRLGRIDFDEDSITEAATALVSKAAEISSELASSDLKQEAE
ncbi:FRG domain-containing protein [Rhodopirellula europaea]|uniref:FRG domain protein n=1 Tax=Rhodopirellula europaea SH398 TaxID=1263868 RepID=M5RZE7_9BACT|nr:FRG domain-containing protein [Rhodopirellula europaea]EMI24591.1 FRG domain protein [Rhodopirellula europaea SH398]